MKRRVLILTAMLLPCAINRLGAADPSPQAAHIQPSAEQLTLDRSETDEQTRYRTDEGWHQQEAAYEDREFARRFNGLMHALRLFSEAYNTGHVIDVKRVKAVQKAWHELEKSAWFRAQKPN